MKNLTFEELLDKLEKALARIEALEKENAILRARLNMNSSNSSLPPSTDRFTKKKDRSLRKKSNKSSGGQIGHKGYTLNKVQKPDSIVDLELNICLHCNTDLQNSKVEDIKIRQVFDIPEIKILVTEYRSQVKTCPHCKEKASAEFPSNVTNPTQYGANIRALITNLNIYHALPYNKIQELLKDVFNLNLSQGTIANTLKKAYVSLEKVENFFKEELKKVEFLHADETGTKVNGKNHWIHSCSNERYTVLTSHPNRGKKAIEEAGILPNFKGVLSHDCWYAYDCYPQILHSLCWAHFLRELQSIEENTDLEFPAKIREFILDLKEKIENKEEISNEKEMSIWLKYVALIEKGKKEEKILYRLVAEGNTLEIPKAQFGKKWIVLGKQNVEGKKFQEFFEVRNSVATLYNKAFVLTEYEYADSFYIVGDYKVEAELVKDAASTKSLNKKNRKDKIIFPYQIKDEQRIDYTEEEFRTKFPEATAYFEQFQEELKNRKADQTAKWFQYGRSQAVTRIDGQKLIIPMVITKKVHAYIAGRDAVPYAGYFIRCKENSKMNLEDAKRILESKNFYRYVEICGTPTTPSSYRISVDDIKDYMIVENEEDEL